MYSMMGGLDLMMRSMDAFMGPPTAAMFAGIDAMTRGMRRAGDDDDGGNGGGGGGTRSSGSWSASSEEGGSQSGGSVSGGDLANEDVKLVDWWVFDMRPGSERVLAEGCETVRHSTSPASLGGRIIARVLNESGEEISDRDRDEHIEFRYSIRHRIHRREKEYDRRVAEGVERIAEQLSKRRGATLEMRKRPAQKAA